MAIRSLRRTVRDSLDERVILKGFRAKRGTFHPTGYIQPLAKPQQGEYNEHMMNTVRILGLDPGLRRLGWGVVDVTGTRLSWVAHGVIEPATDLPLSERLLILFDALMAVIAEWKPDEAAIEETFVNVNPASTLKLGQARAAAMLAPAKAGLMVAEYAALDIKKSIVGAGRADKDQIMFMISRLLPMAVKSEGKGSPKLTADMADALACAITHAHKRRHLALTKVVTAAGRGVA